MNIILGILRVQLLMQIRWELRLRRIFAIFHQLKNRKQSTIVHKYHINVHRFEKMNSKKIQSITFFSCQVFFDFVLLISRYIAFVMHIIGCALIIFSFIVVVVIAGFPCNCRKGVGRMGRRIDSTMR